MKVLLVDIDSTIKNLALEKLRLYYTERGAEVFDNPQFAWEADKIFVSCIFTKNKWKCNE